MSYGKRLLALSMVGVIGLFYLAAREHKRKLDAAFAKAGGSVSVRPAVNDDENDSLEPITIGSSVADKYRSL